MPRTVKTPEERRSELIATAQQLFFTKGYERTSVSDIVKQVGVAQGTFYYHFDSKTAVLEATIQQLIDQSEAILSRIVEDEELNAIEKWHQGLRATNNWKADQKAEMLSLYRFLMRDENALLREKLQRNGMRQAANQFSKIIQQGVREGVFATPHPSEASHIIMAIISTLSERLNALLLQADQVENLMDQALQTNRAVQTAVERVLGAAPGTLPIIEESAIRIWFAK